MSPVLLLIPPAVPYIVYVPISYYVLHTSRPTIPVVVPVPGMVPVPLFSEQQNNAPHLPDLYDPDIVQNPGVYVN